MSAVCTCQDTCTRSYGADVAQVAVAAFTPRNQDELGFHIGDIIEVLSTPEGGWWLGRFGVVEGWFPANHVKATSTCVL